MNFNWQIFDGGFTGLSDHVNGRVREIWKIVLRENDIPWVVKTQGTGELSQGKWRDLRTGLFTRSTEKEGKRYVGID